MPEWDRCQESYVLINSTETFGFPHVNHNCPLPHPMAQMTPVTYVPLLSIPCPIISVSLDPFIAVVIFGDQKLRAFFHHHPHHPHPPRGAPTVFVR